jgi:hypothetical protein
MADAEKHPQARKHHFVPQCWLAGFTDSGQKDGRLWVTDLHQKKQWPTSPPNAGHRHDFYRLSGESFDPLAFETALSKVEDRIAPIFKRLYGQPRMPQQDELSALLSFAAMQWVRVPAFRPWIIEVAERFHQQMLLKALKSKTTWENALKKASSGKSVGAFGSNRRPNMLRSPRYQ